MIVKILDTTGSWIVRTPSEVSMIECIELAEKLRVLIKNFHSREYRGGVVSSHRRLSCSHLVVHLY
jgi:hypothetical protein